MNKRHARMIDGIPAIWDGLSEAYSLGFDAWGRAILELCGDATAANRKETYGYLQLVAPKYEQGNPHFIACENGVIDPWAVGFGETDEEGRYRGFYANDPSLNITSNLPVSWNPNAYDRETDEILDAFANGDALVRTNLEEVLAACIYRGRELQQMAVIVGGGGNGKSTFVHMLCGLLGKANFSAIDLRDVGGKFLTIQLAGKLANLGDDIANSVISGEELSIIKKVVTGETLTCDVKFQNALNIRPYCTLVFTANAFPRLADHSSGMLDRIHGISFTADFRHSARRITNIDAKLDNALSRSYLLNLALARLPGLVERGAFTQTSYSQTMRNDTLLDNDSVAFWIYSKSLTAESVRYQTVESLYEDYRGFCDGTGRKPVEQRAFTRRVNQHLGTRAGKRTGGGRERVLLPSEPR